MRNYTYKNFNFLLDEQSNHAIEFQVDWLYIGGEMIIPIEIGRSEKSDKVSSNIFNKLEQCLYRTIPHFHLIIYSIYKEHQSSNPSDDSDILKLLESRFKVVTILFNVKVHMFVEFMKEISDGNSNKLSGMKYFRRLLPLNWKFLSQIVFLLEDDKNSSKLVPVAVGDNFKIFYPDIEIDQIFKSNDIVGLSEKEKECWQYISSVLTLSGLNLTGQIKFNPEFLKNYSSRTHDERQPIPIDDKYSKEFDSWSSKGKECQARKRKHQQVVRDFIGSFTLTPQQHQILADDSEELEKSLPGFKSQKILYGEPGTGKTTMLLAKCALALLDNDYVDNVVFAFHDSKTWFHQWLLDLIAKQPQDSVLRKRLKLTPLASGRW